MYKFFFFFFFFFSFASYSLAAFDYSRSPSGSSLYDSASINISYSSTDEWPVVCDVPGNWTVGLYDILDNVYMSAEVYSSSQQTGLFSFSGIDADIWAVEFYCSTLSNINDFSQVQAIEGLDYDSVIFSLTSQSSGYFPVGSTFNVENSQNSILNSLIDYSQNIFIIIVCVLGIALAYLIFTVGFNKLFKDKSLNIGGFYVRNLPYKGYNRWRSQKWNSDNNKL